MQDKDIENLIKILHYKKREDLCDLLSKSKSKIEYSSTYGKGYNSFLSTFEIYSPIEYNEKLKNLEINDKKLIFLAVKELYPEKDNSPEIVNIKFYIEQSMQENNFISNNYTIWNGIHSDIQRVSKKLFDDEHYSKAVLSVFIEVNVRVKKLVKNKIGKELDGKDLMFKAFDLNSPILMLSKCSNTTERDIQEGYKFIFGGSMQGIRNPKAHENLIIDKNRAIHFLYLASLLMYKIDESQC